MTAKELLDKINEETILQISMPEVAIRIINEAKSEWCREQKVLIMNQIREMHITELTWFGVKRRVANTPEP